MEELILGLLFAGQKLHVVDNEDVDVAVLIGEGRVLLLLDGIDELVGERLDTDIGDALGWIVLVDLVTDGLHQVSLTETDATVHKEGIVLSARIFGHGLGGGVGKVVRGTDDEALERVAAVEVVAGGLRASRRREANLLLSGRLIGTCDGFGGDFGGLSTDLVLDGLNIGTYMVERLANLLGELALETVAVKDVGNPDDEMPIFVGDQVGAHKPGLKVGLGGDHLELA